MNARNNTQIGLMVAAMAALAILGLGALPSAASVINVDLNNSAGVTYSGTAVAPDPGTFWNGLFRGDPYSPYTSGPLTESDGTTVTAVTLTLGGADNTISDPTALAPDLLRDFLYDFQSSPLTGRPARYPFRSR